MASPETCRHVAGHHGGISLEHITTRISAFSLLIQYARKSKAILAEACSSMTQEPGKKRAREKQRRNGSFPGIIK